MNKVIMIGNLVKDPELNQTGSGVPMTRFSIAVNRNYTNANNEREVDFFNVITWRNLAENCSKFLVKGRKVAVIGSLQNRNFEDKDGIKRFFTEIVADDVEFLTPKQDQDQSGFGVYNNSNNNSNNSNNNNNNSNSSNSGLTRPITELKPIESDDLPF